MRAPLPDLDALDIEALKALILSQHEEKQWQLDELDRQRAALDAQRTHYQAELLERIEQIEHISLIVEKLRRMLFGPKSEKLSIQLDQLELQLEEMEAIHAALVSLPVGDAQADNTGAKPARKPLPAHLPRQIVTHEPKQQCFPECGGDLRHSGEDVSEQLDYVPESFRVIGMSAPSSPAASASLSSKLRHHRDRSHAVWLLPACWRMFWFQTPITARSMGGSHQ